MPLDGALIVAGGVCQLLPGERVQVRLVVMEPASALFGVGYQCELHIPG
jgi:hypothetical protein